VTDFVHQNWRQLAGAGIVTIGLAACACFWPHAPGGVAISAVRLERGIQRGEWRYSFRRGKRGGKGIFTLGRSDGAIEAVAKETCGGVLRKSKVRAAPDSLTLIECDDFVGRGSRFLARKAVRREGVLFLVRKSMAGKTEATLPCSAGAPVYHAAVLPYLFPVADATFRPKRLVVYDPGLERVFLCDLGYRSSQAGSLIVTAEYGGQRLVMDYVAVEEALVLTSCESFLGEVSIQRNEYVRNEELVEEVSRSRERRSGES
jgi:hypothetical protein